MIWAFLLGLIVGLLGAIGLLVWQLMRSDGWDDSNVLNAVRFLHHALRHSEDFRELRYPSGKRPFWYLDKDEIDEVVDSRPD